MKVRVALGVGFLVLFAVACGSRSALFTLDESPVQDASIDAPRDARADADADAPVEDALPPIDATKLLDADRTDCVDPNSTLVYLVTESHALFSFDPSSRVFRRIGSLACPGTTADPFSMAVDRKGVAYVLFSDGQLFRASTKTGSCVSANYPVGQKNFATFGMGFASDQGGPSETLYVAGDGRQNHAKGLARIDVLTRILTPIGEFAPAIDQAELTGTGDGHLYAFYTKATAPGSFIGDINKLNGHVSGEAPLPTVELGSAWAFAAWGGDFYTFTAPNLGSSVTRVSIKDGSVTPWTTLDNERVVGAGVSTCAPSE